MGTAESGSGRALSVPVWVVVVVAASLLLGAAGGLALGGFLAQKQITFSPQGLVSFVFTVAGGAGSVILAVIAIVLSKNAEDALTRRSEEGIRLQTEVYVRTTEALKSIQTSTGVTERRVEDIISGRTGLIAREVVSTSELGRAGLSKEAEEELVQTLTDKLRSELLPLVASPPAETERRLSQMAARAERRGTISSRWARFRTAVVGAIGLLPTVKVLQDTRGQDSATGDDFWDCILEVEGRRVAVDVRTTEQLAFWGRDRELADRLAAIGVGCGMAAVISVADSDPSRMEELASFVARMDDLAARATAPRIVRLWGSPESIASQIAERVPGLVGSGAGASEPSQSGS